MRFAVQSNGSRIKLTSKSNALEALMQILADWAGLPDVTVYLYGSRVRGDNRPDSDVDVHLRFNSPWSTDFVSWWASENSDQFMTINETLPGQLHILDDVTEFEKTLRASLEASVPIHTYRNIRAISSPMKSV